MDTNPFRNFLTLTTPSSTLYHTIIAVAAMHLHRKHLPSIYDVNTDLEATPTVSGFTHHTKHTTYQDYLQHKSRALQLLHHDIQTPMNRYEASTVACIILLIWLDTYEPVGTTWKAHLSGLKKLLWLRKRRLKSSEFYSQPNSYTEYSMQICFESMCAM